MANSPAMKIAFYSPMKPPDHPGPSGDRTMANLLIKALAHSGHVVELVSRYRSFTKQPDIELIKQQAEDERAALIERFAAGELSKPDLWFTYHTYYKAPDLIGPEMAATLGVPYATAEASYAGKRDKDMWCAMQAPVTDCIKTAAVNFCLTDIDRRGLERLVGADQLADLPPFLDTKPFKGARAARSASNSCRLLTVAMMRPGVKFESYRLLASTLHELRDANWTLTIVGDGGERNAVERLFSGIDPQRVIWTGELQSDDLRQEMANADVFVWPGYGEAYGLAYLEAQASGLPVVALDTAGVPSVVRNGHTGLLTPASEPEQFGEALLQLINKRAKRLSLGAGAVEFAHNKRNLETAAATLDAALKSCITTRGK